MNNRNTDQQQPNPIGTTRPSMQHAKGVIAALVASFALVACMDHDPEFSAVWETQKAIKNQLVSPASAEFNRSACRVAATTKDGKYRIAYVEVDSQNRLGAKLRSYGLGLVMDKGDDAAVIASQVYSESPKKADLTKLTAEMGESWQVADWVR